MRHVAERVIAQETSGNSSSKTRASGAFHALEELRPHLATLMGTTGFRALLMRALALANAEGPWLRAVHVNAKGTLERVGTPEVKADPGTIAEGNVVLLAQLLGLLVAFIGEDLTLQLAREVWPKLSLEELDAGKRR